MKKLLFLITLLPGLAFGQGFGPIIGGSTSSAAYATNATLATNLVSGPQLTNVVIRSSSGAALTVDTNVLVVTNGNVGIGTTAPDRKLEINAADGGALRLTYNDSDGAASSYCDFTNNSSGYLSIWPSGGRVGIGKVPSSYNLDVSGTIASTGITVSGNGTLRVINIQTTGITTTPTYGVSTYSELASAGIKVRYSPAYQQYGSAWNISGTPAANFLATTDWIVTDTNLVNGLITGYKTFNIIQTASVITYDATNEWMRVNWDRQIWFTSNVVSSASITATNGYLMPTNYVEANFTPVAGHGLLVWSNNVLYAVTATKTNVMVNNEP